MSAYRLCTLIASLILATPAIGFAQQPERVTRIGVAVSVQVNITAREAREFLGFLHEALEHALAVQVVVIHDAEEGAGGAARECGLAAACLRQLGARAGVDELLVFSLVRVGQEFQIDAMWADIERGRMASRGGFRLAVDSDWRAELARLGPELLPHVAVRARADAAPAPAQRDLDAPRDSKPRRTAAAPPRAVAPPRARETGRRVGNGVWISGGVAAGALLAGAVIGVTAKRDYDALRAAGCAGACPKDQLASIDRRALAADILFGAALVSGATALLLYAKSGRAERAPTTALRAHLDSQTIGLSIVGRF